MLPMKIGSEGAKGQDKNRQDWEAYRVWAFIVTPIRIRVIFLFLEDKVCLGKCLSRVRFELIVPGYKYVPKGIVKRIQSIINPNYSYLHLLFSTTFRRISHRIRRVLRSRRVASLRSPAGFQVPRFEQSEPWRPGASLSSRSALVLVITLSII